MRYIGDTHSKFDKYLSIVADCQESIQVGDFGAGFKPIPDLSSNHRFIRGNHDDPEICRAHPNWIPDGHYENGTFFLGGGQSIDRYQRIDGVDFWEEEEMTYGQLFNLMNIYEDSKADIVVSHECPHEISPLIFNKRGYRIDNPSRTSQALSSILYINRPKIWIFGHWHTPVDEVIDGTRFICLSELQFIDL